jgi:hypothetical protein
VVNALTQEQLAAISSSLMSWVGGDTWAVNHGLKYLVQRPNTESPDENMLYIQVILICIDEREFHVKIMCRHLLLEILLMMGIVDVLHGIVSVTQVFFSLLQQGSV